MTISTDSWHYKLRNAFYSWSAKHWHSRGGYVTRNGEDEFNPKWPLGGILNRYWGHNSEYYCSRHLTNCRYIWEIATIPIKAIAYGVALVFISPILGIIFLKDRYCKEVIFKEENE